MVPLLDLATLAPADLDAVCRDIGFFQITGHGVDPAVIDAAWQTARAFFDRPDDEKLAVAFPEPGYPYGYSPVAYETLSYSRDDTTAAPDLKQSLAVGPDALGPLPDGYVPSDPDEIWVRSPSRWPAQPAELRPAWEAYFAAMSDLAARLLRLMARALDLDEHFFDPLIDRHASAMRALDYPHQDVPPQPGQLRAGAHTDYGTLTILLQEPGRSGLQVLGHDGAWHDVPAVEGAFVVNLGDSLERWTNDRWRSTLHRVVNPPVDPEATTNRRQSIAFFHNANWDARIENLTDEPARYEPVLAGAHLMAKFKRTVQAD